MWNYRTIALFSVAIAPVAWGGGVGLTWAVCCCPRSCPELSAAAGACTVEAWGVRVMVVAPIEWRVHVASPVQPSGAGGDQHWYMYCSETIAIITLIQLQRDDRYHHSDTTAARWSLSSLWYNCSEMIAIITLIQLQRDDRHHHSDTTAARWSPSSLWYNCSEMIAIITLIQLQRDDRYHHSDTTAARWSLSSLWYNCSEMIAIITLIQLQWDDRYHHSDTTTVS